MSSRPLPLRLKRKYKEDFFEYLFLPSFLVEGASVSSVVKSAHAD
jgi:hypothetical protein